MQQQSKHGLARVAVFSAFFQALAGVARGMWPAQMAHRRWCAAHSLALLMAFKCKQSLRNRFLQNRLLLTLGLPFYR